MTARGSNKSLTRKGSENGSRMESNGSQRSVQWKPEEFFEEVKAVLHPKEALPQVLKEAVVQVMGHSPIEMPSAGQAFFWGFSGSLWSLHQMNIVSKRRWIRGLQQCWQIRGCACGSTCWRQLVLLTWKWSIWLLKEPQIIYGSHTKPPNFPDDWKPSFLISVDELLESSSP